MGWHRPELPVEVENGWTTHYPAGRLALSEPAIDRALAIGPGYFLGHCAKGELLLARSDFAGALAAYRQALALHPSEARALARMGRVVLGLGRPEEVASHIALALRLNPLQPRHVAWGHFVAGMALFHLGRTEAAYEHFRKAGAADPNLKWAWLWMVAIDGLEGRRAQAAANLQRVLACTRSRRSARRGRRCIPRRNFTPAWSRDGRASWRVSGEPAWPSEDPQEPWSAPQA
jgi:tetratricopeptide (TPR) repeat protein